MPDEVVVYLARLTELVEGRPVTVDGLFLRIGVENIMNKLVERDWSSPRWISISTLYLAGDSSVSVLSPV